MKKAWLLYVPLGLFLYLLFLVIELPASWFAWGLNRYTNGSVRLDPIAGSLWHGTGRLVIYYPRSMAHDFGQAEWRINPLWLLAGRAQLALRTDSQDRQIKTTIALARDSFTLADTDATVSAPFITRLFPPASLIDPQGKIRLTASRLNIGSDTTEGTATLEWRDAGSSLSSVQPLGDYRLDIVGAGKTANLKLATTRGSLELTGQGRWEPAGGKLQLNGAAVPRERAEELEPLLKFMGDNQGAGRRNFALNVPLPPLAWPGKDPAPAGVPAVKEK